MLARGATRLVAMLTIALVMAVVGALFLLYLIRLVKRA